MNHSTVTETEFQVGDLVMVTANLCKPGWCDPAECGCDVANYLDGHVGRIVNVKQHTSPAGLDYYQVDGYPHLLHADEIEHAEILWSYPAVQS